MGKIAQLLRMGMMMTQTIGTCPVCDGRGESISEEFLCKKCKGKKIVEEEKEFEIDIEKGMPEGHRFKFEGESDEVPGVEAGDLIVELEIRPEKLFKRRGADLSMEKEITLFESINGFSFNLEHLNGKVIEIQSPLHRTIKNDEILKVPEFGMPFFHHPFKYGNLLIMFHVKIPEALPKNLICSLKSFIPNISKYEGESFSKMKVHKLREFLDSDKFLKEEPKEEDEEEEQRGGVQCASQ